MMPENVEKYINRYIKAMKSIPETEKIKWKGKQMSKKHWQNWQYATTKEVLAVHEVIDPYDWKLDLEMNPDFKLWQEEIDNKK